MSAFFDLPADERAATYERAEETTGMPWHDLPAEERGYWMDRAVDESETR